MELEQAIEEVRSLTRGVQGDKYREAVCVVLEAASKQLPKAPEEGCVEVQVGVAVDVGGRWCAYGHHRCTRDQIIEEAASDVGEHFRAYVLTASLPRPKVETVQADVEVM